MIKYSGWALTDRDGVLAALAARGVHPAFPGRVDCEHITRHCPDDRPAPAQVTTARLVAVAADDRIQALVAEVCGGTARPDGSVYHVTYSLAAGVEPVESNVLLTRPGVAWRRFEPITVTLASFLRPLPGKD